MAVAAAELTVLVAVGKEISLGSVRNSRESRRHRPDLRCTQPCSRTRYERRYAEAE